MVELIATWITHLISTLGYPGIIIAMGIESALIPLPSEVIMPFSGYLAATGRFNLELVALAGAVGNVSGSLIAYAIGYFGHEKIIRRFIRKFGKWVLISENELDETEKLLHKYKDAIVLISRVVPGIRSVISLPCGFAKIPLPRFILLTFFGSLVWSFVLAWIGFVLGQNWKSIGPLFHKADLVVGILIVLAVAWYIYHKIKSK